MRHQICSVVLALTAGLSGCSNPRSAPVAPSVSNPVVVAPVPTVPTPSVAAVAPSAPPAFALAVSSFRVRLFRRDSRSPFQYEPETLEVKETSGQSSAALRTLDIDVSGGERDRDCAQEQIVRGQIVAATTSRDLVATLGYCVPYAVTRNEVSEVTFTATFVDDQGREGELKGSANVADCTLHGAVGLISCK